MRARRKRVIAFSDRGIRQSLYVSGPERGRRFQPGWFLQGAGDFSQAGNSGLLDLEELLLGPGLFAVLDLPLDLAHEVDRDRRSLVAPFAPDEREDLGDLVAGHVEDGRHLEAAVELAVDMDRPDEAVQDHADEA